MSIIQNKKAFHEYFIEEKYEAGLMLQGWEIKAIREGRVQLKEAYVTSKGNEFFLFGSHISPLTSASTHIIRNRQAHRQSATRWLHHHAARHALQRGPRKARDWLGEG
jgi:tmRNA-binding protein